MIQKGLLLFYCFILYSLFILYVLLSLSPLIVTFLCHEWMWDVLNTKPGELIDFCTR